MLFNSIEFAVFFPIIFFVYWFIVNKNLQVQNIFLLAASYYFYSCWDWRFLFLLIFSTLLDYTSGIAISRSKKISYKKIWLWISIVINIGFLGFFKYYNFFISSFSDVFTLFGVKFSTWTLNIILPVGISFYTFHGLSYVIDIYYGRIKVEKNFVNYSVFVSFFPLLVAGPIERANHLLPQIKKERKFEYGQAVSGLKQILWGLFKKLVIADNCAVFANLIFENPDQYSGSTLFLGAIFFAFQIYGDFSGYSDIALGSARLLGIELLRNFSYPYFSRDIAEFWRRWHISLSSWFRDYIYVPLGGSRVNKWIKLRNTFIIFIISGFWHGPNWTFVIWGLINAFYFLPLLLTDSNRIHMGIASEGRIFPKLNDLIKIISTFILTTLAWIFFRAESVTSALQYISGIFSYSFFSIPKFIHIGKAFNTFILVLFFVIIEWNGRAQEFAIAKTAVGKPRLIRWLFYAIIIFILGMFLQTKESPFIYFQF
jgi:alginate O-acetyltransferase complex protein AlgI